MSIAIQQLQHATYLARRSFSNALHGMEGPTGYLSDARNATETLEAVRPLGCLWPHPTGDWQPEADASPDMELLADTDSGCRAWRWAAQEVLRTRRAACYRAHSTLQSNFFHLALDFFPPCD